MRKAKVFQNGQSQAVRLPKEFRFNSKEVCVKRVGNTVVLIEENSVWDELRKGLSKFSSDFMASRQQPPQQKRRRL